MSTAATTTSATGAGATRPPLAEMIRPNFSRMHFYKSARGEFQGRADVLLDANENPFDNGHNRYPDPLHGELRAAVAAAYGVPVDAIFVGAGSSEALDLLMRLVGVPGRDRVTVLPPTFGIYEVDAALNDLAVASVPLDADLQPDVDGILSRAQAGRDKILFLCTPNNPTGHDLDPARVTALVEGFPGLVVLDQAYVEFSGQPPYRQLWREHPHVLVTETMSKAYGLAGSRVGLAFGDPALVKWLNDIKPPYNVSIESERLALAAVREREGRVAEQIGILRAERDLLAARLPDFEFVARVYPTDANFFLLAVPRARALYDFLVARGIVVRDQTGKFAGGHLRVNVGTPAENARLLEALEAFARAPR